MATSPFVPSAVDGGTGADGTWPPTGADVLACVEARLFPPLVMAAQVRALARAAATIPAKFVDWTYVEPRLRAGRHPVDLIIGIDRRHLGEFMWARSSNTLGRSDAVNPHWRTVETMARGWSNLDRSTRDGVKRAWLEFDVDADDPSALVPAPGVFLDLVHRVAPESVSLALQLTGRLDGARHDPARRAVLAHLLSELPPTAVLSSIGLFERGGAPRTRLCVTGLAGGALVRYLRAVGQPGNAKRVRALNDALAAGAPRAVREAMVHLDVADSLGPSIGIEFALARRPQLRGTIAERWLLERLVTLGLANRAKVFAMSRWPGCDVAQMPHELWPSIVSRHVNHVKLVCGERGEVVAKAYLAFHHRPRVVAGGIRARGRSSTSVSIS